MTEFTPVLNSIKDLSLDNINSLLSTAQKFKKNQDSWPKMAKSRFCSFFIEDSTRTKFSFQIAAQNLGMNIVDVDPKKTSLNKGESLDETFKTFAAQGINVLCLRSKDENLLEDFRTNSPLALINGGDGTREHPSQALLDLMTIAELFPSLQHKKISIVGDCLHSRVANSLCELLPQYKMEVELCGPDYFLPEKAGIKTTTNFKESTDSADIIYLLRVQKERHNRDFDLEKYITNYGLRSTTKPVLHPGPFNLNVEIGQKVLDSNHYKGYLQVENSIFMRMAILHHMLRKNYESN